MDEEIRVLLIDDSAPDADLILECLARAGYRVMHILVDNAVDVKRLLSEQSWDLVLCDHAMIGFDAFEALEIFKAFDLDIPFIVISGTIGEEKVVKLMKDGCHDCIMKFNLARLPRVVERELEDARIRMNFRINQLRLRKYQLLAENTIDPMFFVDHQGTILEVNTAATRVYGYSKMELLSKKLPGLASHHNSIKSEVTMTWTAYEGKVYEAQHSRKDGTTLDVEISLQGAFLGNSRIYLGVVRDITERKRSEIMIKDAAEAAEMANRAKSQFLANMSHEFRTPMNAIIGMTDLVLMTELTQMQKKCLDFVKSASARLLALINSILDLSKIESGKVASSPSEFKISDLLEEQLITFQPIVANKSIVLDYVLDRDVPESLIGDPLLLYQVLNNLVGNAIKFTPSGKVSITVGMTKRVSPDDIKLKFLVTDTGIGIPANLLDRLFIYFNQLDSSITKKYGGSGLGLAISQALVKEMGGKIEVKSEPGRGSTFYFTADFKLPSYQNSSYLPIGE